MSFVEQDPDVFVSQRKLNYNLFKKFSLKKNVDWSLI